ncbi:MAG: hypothetical protein ABW046_20545 [Actinoplanes sp.]
MKIHLPALGPDLPVHPFTGFTAIGLRRNGAPIWPVRGGAPDDDTGDGDDDAGDDEGDGDDQDDDADKLGEPGKKALEAMKTRVKKSQTALRPWTALAREMGVKTPEELKALLADKTKDGKDAPDAEQIRREARAEVERETVRERVLDKIEAKARKFADPADAAALLLREGDVDDYLDGSRIDAGAIADALDELLERKPYLAASGTAGDGSAAGGRKPKTDKSQGSRGSKTLSGREAGLAEAQKRFGVKSTT